MSQSNDEPWLRVTDAQYFQDVLGSMVKFRPGEPGITLTKVRFGRTGEGVHPNYQLEAANGEVQAYRGSNHEPDQTAPNGRYRNEDLSEPHDVDAVKALLIAAAASRMG